MDGNLSSSHGASPLPSRCGRPLPLTPMPYGKPPVGNRMQEIQPVLEGGVGLPPVLRASLPCLTKPFDEEPHQEIQPWLEGGSVGHWVDEGQLTPRRPE